MAGAVAFGDFITSEYEILRNIFSLLSVEELDTCKLVCRAWKNAVVATVSARRRIQCLWETRRQSKPPYVRSDAELVISFSMYPLYGNFNWRYLTDAAAQFQSTFGILISLSGKTPIYQPLRNQERKNARNILASIRFPPWDGVNICHFHYAGCDATIEDMEEYIRIPADAKIKAVIVLTNTHPHTVAAVEYLRNRQESFPLAGCYLTSNDPDVYCYIFWGPNVYARSCVLSETISNEERVNERIKIFSESVKQTKNSAMLIFSCIQRNDSHELRHGATDNLNGLYCFEKKAIDEYFPNCDRVGCLSGGELGLDYPTVATIKRRRMDYYHAFSTILMYIAYK